MSNTEFPPIPGEEEDFPLERRNARHRWDILRSRLDRRIPLEEQDPAVAEQSYLLVEEIFNLWSEIIDQKERGEIVMKDDVDRIMQKFNTALSISNDKEVRDARDEFLTEFPDAGIKKY